MDKRSKMLANDSIGSLLFKLSLPAAIGMIVHALYNVVDAIFVGRGVGVMGIAGIAIGFPIQLAVMAIAQTIGIGAASIVSRSLGARNMERAEKTMGNAFTEFEKGHQKATKELSKDIIKVIDMALKGELKDD